MSIKENFYYKILEKETKNRKIKFNEIPKTIIPFTKVMLINLLERNLFFFGFDSNGDYLFSYLTINNQKTIINVSKFSEYLIKTFHQIVINERVTFIQITESMEREYLFIYMFHQDKNLIKIYPYPKSDQMKSDILSIYYKTKSFTFLPNDSIIQTNNIFSICFTTDSTIELVNFSLSKDLKIEKRSKLDYESFEFKNTERVREDVDIVLGEHKLTYFDIYQLDIEELLFNKHGNILNYDVMIIGNENDMFYSIITFKTKIDYYVYYCMISIFEKTLYLILETNEKKPIKVLAKDIKKELFFPKQKLYTLDNSNLYQGKSLPYLAHPVLPIIYTRD